MAVVSFGESRPILISVVQYQDELKAGGFTVFDLLDKAATLDADGVELRREVWPNYQAEAGQVAEHARERNLRLTYATHSILFNPDAASHDLLLHDIETASALGSPVLRFFPGATPADRTSPEWARAEAAVQHAVDHGVVLALENYGRSPGGTLAEVAFLLDQFPSLRTNIDIGNYDTHGEDVVQAIGKIGHRAVYAHLKDKAGTKSDATTALGDGTLPMQTIIAALNALPQSLLYCFEFVGDGEADARIVRSLAYLRGSEGAVGA